MKRLQILKSILAGGASAAALVHPAAAKLFDIPEGDLAAALGAYMQQSGIEIVYLNEAVRGHHSRGARGDYTETAALTRILQGTGFSAQSVSASAIGIVREPPEPERVAQVTRRAVPVPAAPMSVETVVVTAEKKTENIQQVPIAVTALSQQQLTERQIAGGPDLVKDVPNLTFTKTNFTGYNLEIRGIGTQAISVATDPAVAVAFNDIPFIRNHFFEQEFFDVQDVEVLRGPQGTLFGRNATAGVVDIKSALPDDQYEAMLSADFGNYDNRRLEGMLNIPVASDKLDIRLAGEWTKRSGYTFDETTDQSVDGRNLWSGRVTVGWKPASDLQTDLVWEHFSEDDNRLRSGKQLCEKDPGPTTVDGLNLNTLPGSGSEPGSFNTDAARTWLSQGCLPTSLYSPNAFETPNGQTIPFVAAGEFIFGILNPIDPYASQTQSTNLRVIQSALDPQYRAKNDTLEFNANYAISPELTLTSQTGYNHDFLFSTEDFNRFDTAPGIFPNSLSQGPGGAPGPVVNGVYCDPQLGCSSSMVAEDLSQEHAWQFSQELRLASNFSGPLNFSLGTNYTHYQTIEDYYVFFNLLSAMEQRTNGGGPGGYDRCFISAYKTTTIDPIPISYLDYQGVLTEIPSNFACGQGFGTGTYIDPNSLDSVNGQGHNYFLSTNPYQLNSWAGFGEVYYNVTQDLKLTGGLRWTDDRKLFTDIPSQVYLLGGGYPVAGIVKQGWDEWTGRFVADWSPQLDLTDSTLLYASYAHGYKGGGANPPGPATDFLSPESLATHPPTFAPEHIEAFELGTKNTALDDKLTINGDVFFYNYHGYQISQIVDRTSINLNFNATVEGAELESTWEPLPGLKFNLAGGWEDSAVDKGQSAIDLMDRTNNQPGWMVVRPFLTDTSNCILPANVVRQILQLQPYIGIFDGLDYACDVAYNPSETAFDPNAFPFNVKNAFADTGFNPATAPNDGAGFAKNLSGNKLPNSPPFTLSLGGQYSMPVSDDWLATLRADFYWQGNTFARIFNDKPYDSIHGYTNLNLALMLDSQDGWDVMFYVKNVFDVTAITGAFLNSDDTALTTNIFTTDPRLFGVRVTKHLDESEGFWGSDWSGADWIKDIFADEDGGKPPLWIELGGAFAQLDDARQNFLPPFTATPPQLSFLKVSPVAVERPASYSWDGNAKMTFQPEDWDWSLSAGIVYGRSSRSGTVLGLPAAPIVQSVCCYIYPAYQKIDAQNTESHMILDFQAGKDVGLGMFGTGGQSRVNFGLRYVRFDSSSSAVIYDQPMTVSYTVTHHPQYKGTFRATRRFIGLGPAVSWDESASLTENATGGGMTFDWGVNGAVLFGRQHVNGFRRTSGVHASAVYQNSAMLARNRQVLVPNLGGFAGLSWHYQNAKVSFGYRADEFFGAMDGGIDTYKAYNRGFFGPYANISIGLGG